MAYDHAALIKMLLEQKFPGINVSLVEDRPEAITVHASNCKAGEVGKYMRGRWPGAGKIILRVNDKVKTF